MREEDEHLSPCTIATPLESLWLTTQRRLRKRSSESRCIRFRKARSTFYEGTANHRSTAEDWLAPSPSPHFPGCIHHLSGPICERTALLLYPFLQKTFLLFFILKYRCRTAKPPSARLACIPDYRPPASLARSLACTLRGNNRPHLIAHHENDVHHHNQEDDPPSAQSARQMT